jgi:hypothetical protein
VVGNLGGGTGPPTPSLDKPLLVPLRLQDFELYKMSIAKYACLSFATTCNRGQGLKSVQRTKPNLLPAAFTRPLNEPPYVVRDER